MKIPAVAIAAALPGRILLGPSHLLLPHIVSYASPSLAITVLLPLLVFRNLARLAGIRLGCRATHIANRHRGPAEPSPQPIGKVVSGFAPEQRAPSTVEESGTDVFRSTMEFCKFLRMAILCR
jgi:hypothetical protein